MFAMNPRATCGVLSAIVALCLLMSLRAAAQASPFDTSRATTMTGRVATVILQYTDRTFLVLDIEAAPGKRERWAIEGSPADELGWGPRTLPLKLGETVTVNVFRPRAGTNLADLVPGDHPGLQEMAKGGRVARGLDLTFADGRKLAFGSR
jgi:hypothetical protein